jgi:hypothetical protein
VWFRDHEAGVPDEDTRNEYVRLRRSEASPPKNLPGHARQHQSLALDAVEKRITSCQASFPLAHLVSAIEPRIVFLAKDNALARSFTLPIAAERVIRFSNYATGLRHGKHYTLGVR